jgi:hypothetical protein
MSSWTKFNWSYTGHTQKNGAVLKEFTFDTAPFFCVCPVYGPVAGSREKEDKP